MAEKYFTPGMTTCPACKTRTFYQDQPWKRVCVPCYVERKTGVAPTAPPKAAQIEPAMLRCLIQLCHPDRHGNSQASNTATMFLLELKKKTHFPN